MLSDSSMPILDRSKSGFFIGDVALDEYFRVAQWPGIGTKVHVETLGSYVGGGIANAACVYAGYGAGAYLISALNSSDVSHRLRNSLIEKNVDDRYLTVDDELPDSRTFVFLAEGEHVIFLLEMGDYIPDLTPDCFSEMCGGTFLYSSIQAIMRLRLENQRVAPLEIVGQLRDHGVKLILDLDVGGDRDAGTPYIEAADVLFLNEVGLSNYSQDRSGEMFIRKLLDGGVKLVVVTRAAAGCSVYTNARCFSIPGIPVAPVDVTGAGDTFGGAFVFGLTRSGDLELIANFANAAAARAISEVGAQRGVADVSGVLEFMVSRGIPVAGYPECFR